MASLPQEVIDPIDLLLLHDRQHQFIQFLERLGTGAVGLLVDDSGSLQQLVSGQTLGHRLEGHWRNRQIVDVFGILAQDLVRFLEDVQQRSRIGLVEPAARESQVPGEIRPLVFVDGQPAELVQRGSDPHPEVLVSDVATPITDQQPGLRHQPVLGELIERRQHHPLGQVPGGPEQNGKRWAWLDGLDDGMVLLWLGLTGERADFDLLTVPYPNDRSASEGCRCWQKSWGPCHLRQPRSGRRCGGDHFRRSPPGSGGDDSRRSRASDPRPGRAVRGVPGRECRLGIAR